MTEDFLQYLWKYRLIGPAHYLVGGETCIIEHPGQQNKDAGPDFFNARIVINGTVWAGNVEIHILASDWIRHQHHKDPAYDNVILHVVFQADIPVSQKNGKSMPTLVLENKINKRLFIVYQGMMLNQHWIPCANLLSDCNPLTWHHWIDRMVVERLDRKSGIILDRLRLYAFDWSEVFFQVLARNLGTPVNAVPMELLARSVPLIVLRKHRNFQDQLEALLFGQAALIDSRNRNPYVVHLRKEYAFMAHKYKLKPVAGHLWKFLRMRPAHFPTIRIAQLAQMLHSQVDVFSNIVDSETISGYEKMFSIGTSKFWDTHYSFTSRSPDRPKIIGKQMIRLILINTVIPFLYLFGKVKHSPKMREKAYELLHYIPAENNAVVRKWKALGVPIDTAYRSQGMLELYKRYCNRKRCLSCAVGNAILSRSR